MKFFLPLGIGYDVNSNKPVMVMIGKVGQMPADSSLVYSL